jgi:hypothetical protein
VGDGDERPTPAPVGVLDAFPAVALGDAALGDAALALGDADLVATALEGACVVATGGLDGGGGAGVGARGADVPVTSCWNTE